MSNSGPAVRGLRLAPFRALRYVPERVGSLAAVTSPPYDVVVRPEGQRHLETADPHNVVRLILPTAEPPDGRHRKAAWALFQWQEEGVLALDPKPALYVYEQREGDQVQRGLIGALRLTPPEERIVLPHEDVMPGPVADRAALMRATAANLEPLLLAYHGDDGEAAEVVERTVARPPLLATTTEDGIQHRLWAITDPRAIAAVDADLSRHQAVIADGHHRWATYLLLQAEHETPSAWDYGLVLLVDTSRYPLRVRAIHRVLPQLPVEQAVEQARDAFRVRELSGPLPEALAALAAAAAEGNAFLLTGDGRFHLLDRPDTEVFEAAIPRDRPEEWRRLDATVLHSMLLDRIWDVPDSPEHIHYIHDTEAAVERATQFGGTAVLIHPVRESVVHDLAKQGVTMPRKSTSFGPKPATGLVLRSLELDGTST
ncbi:DUF1015 domain-containing protein [Streptomyces sp. ME03-5709C]|nr:DUF1015 domain-containing protein [Streptomyces sp. ME03-5709C]